MAVEALVADLKWQVIAVSLGVDMDKHAIESFKANHKEAEGIVTDIAKLTKAKLNKLLDGQTCGHGRWRSSMSGI